MLKNWYGLSHTMVSLIPNAHSIPYRFGKYLAEKNNTWIYGLEMPQNSLREEFELAGYSEIKEYTIGLEEAFSFLPSDNYVRVAMEKMMQEDIDNWGQGYLLVTIGKSKG